MATRRSTSKSQAGSGSSGGTTKRNASGSSASNGSASNGSTGSRSATTGGSTRKTARAAEAGTGSRRRTRTSEASAAGVTARARIGAATRRAGTRRPKNQAGPSEPADATIPATDEALAASNAKKALSPDMPRVAWLRQQLQNLEAERRERLMKVVQLTLIAIVFITFVLQNSQGVNVHFLLFSLNIRLIWVIFGCGLLGAAGGYLLGRPEKSLRALFPPKEKPANRRRPNRRTTAA